MLGAIQKADILSHPLVTLRWFGWKVLLRALVAGPDRTFLSIVAQTMFAPSGIVQLPRFLQRGIRLELRAMQIYQSLAYRFVDVERLREFFEELAKEEQRHAELLELCYTSAGPEAWKPARMAPWFDLLPQLEETMNDLERRESEVVSVSDAMRLLIAIESSEINEVFMAIVEASESRFVRAVSAFRTAEDEHTALITRTIPVFTPELADLWKPPNQTR
jgi:rubrerythrin